MKAPTVKSEDMSLKERTSRFLADHLIELHTLAEFLNKAHISHYSSGCGHKNIAFDLFPAAAYIEEFLSLLSLERAWRAKAHNGFKDASINDAYNPARDFIMYLKRWSLFAEQVMRGEGVTERGVAAARAKLIMDDLLVKLSLEKSATNKKPEKKADKKQLSPQDINPFLKLLWDIGTTLEMQYHTNVSHHKNNPKHGDDANYHSVLAMAQTAFFSAMPERRKTA